MPRSPSVILVLILASAVPAGAVEFRHAEKPFVAVHNCTCRLDGEEIALGARRCIATPEGTHEAVCVMEQNVTSWRPSRDGCPQASLAAPRG